MGSLQGRRRGVPGRPPAALGPPVEVSETPRNLGLVPTGLGPHPQTTLPIVVHESDLPTASYPQPHGP